MEHIKLNLARKWRSHDFESIIGQDMAIKMLKNSLYASHYFPVYLFAGQRGCGKTTTARVFASALNCVQLPEFQKNPKTTSLPCAQCDSCLAIRQGRHQDVIELDAASHTGVDNIRQLIDTASFLPTVGTKKVYLIDEAHMLSKAAFNALLKILEEPPQSVVFILATTNPDKIIETVRSRCFRLYFKPIATNTLAEHLKKVCVEEKIPHDDSGITYLASHADGSARDALNTLEQVRFSSGGVTKKTVTQVLGHIDDEHLVTLLVRVYKGNMKAVLFFWEEHNFETASAEFIWSRLLVLLRALVWLHHGVEPPADTSAVRQLLEKAVQVMPLTFVYAVMKALYGSEQLFLRTTEPQGLLEMVLLNVCRKQKKQTNSDDSEGGTPAAQGTPVALDMHDADVHDDEDDFDNDNHDDDEQEEVAWKSLVREIEKVADPLVLSLFAQGTLREVKNHTVVVSFPKELAFFNDIVHDTSATWLPLVQKKFGASAQLVALFDKEKQLSPIQMQKPLDQPEIVKQSDGARNAYQSKAVPVPPKMAGAKAMSFGNGTSAYKQSVREKPLDVTDKEHWKKTNLVLQHFPGVVTIAQEVQQ